MESKAQIEFRLKALIPVLIAKFNIKKIGLFGSFVTDTATPDSDIDILVDFEKTPGWEYFDLMEFLENELGRKIDLVTPNALKSPLKTKILNQVEYLV
jgi:predicted nucleotidyltransferase